MKMQKSVIFIKKSLKVNMGEKTEKYIIFTIPIEKVVARFDKKRQKITKNISYMLQFIDIARFMAS